MHARTHARQRAMQHNGRHVDMLDEHWQYLSCVMDRMSWGVECLQGSQGTAPLGTVLTLPLFTLQLHAPCLLHACRTQLSQ